MQNKTTPKTKLQLVDENTWLEFVTPSQQLNQLESIFNIGDNIKYLGITGYVSDIGIGNHWGKECSVIEIRYKSGCFFGKKQFNHILIPYPYVKFIKKRKSIILSNRHILLLSYVVITISYFISLFIK